jgi:hypothetical protein
METYEEEGQITSEGESEKGPSKQTMTASWILRINGILSLFMGLRAIGNRTDRIDLSELIFMCSFFLVSLISLLMSAHFILKIKKSYWGFLALLFFISMISIVLALSIKINLAIPESPGDKILATAYFSLLSLSFLLILLDKENY